MDRNATALQKRQLPSFYQDFESDAHEQHRRAHMRRKGCRVLRIWCWLVVLCALAMVAVFHFPLMYFYERTFVPEMPVPDAAAAGGTLLNASDPNVYTLKDMLTSAGVASTEAAAERWLTMQNRTFSPSEWADVAEQRGGEAGRSVAQPQLRDAAAGLGFRRGGSGGGGQLGEHLRGVIVLARPRQPLRDQVLQHALPLRRGQRQVRALGGSVPDLALRRELRRESAARPALAHGQPLRTLSRSPALAGRC